MLRPFGRANLQFSNSRDLRALTIWDVVQMRLCVSPIRKRFRKKIELLSDRYAPLETCTVQHTDFDRDHVQSIAVLGNTVDARLLCTRPPLSPPASHPSGAKRELGGRIRVGIERRRRQASGQATKSE